MKKISMIFRGLLAFLLCHSAQAYYLENAVPGTLTLKVSGACAIPTTQTKAYIADISDDEHSLIGWGVITATGHIIALRENKLDIADRKNFATQQQSATDFIDLAGDTFKTFLTQNGVRCEIAHLQAGIDSTLTVISAGSSGKAVMHAKVAGYEVERCQDSGDVQTCKARKIIGAIDFIGRW
jgi:hypothetical protein